MENSTSKAHPTVARDVRRTAGTMFAALYGEVALHPWIVEQGSEPDVYALFHDRSLAMEWLNNTGVTGLWTMNDAGQDPLAASDLSLATWFQVGLEPVSTACPMPVQAFLRCAGDVTARIGTFELEAVQVLLPVNGLDASTRRKPALMPSLFNAGWFADADPKTRTSVRIRLDSGHVPSMAAAAPYMQEHTNTLDQDVFVCESYSLTEREPSTIRPPFADSFWNGPAWDCATFHGTLAEWSLDALGWLGGFLGDLAVWHGVTSPLLLTATRQ